MTDRSAYLGIDIGGSFVKYGAIDDEGKVIISRRTPTDLSSGPLSLLRVLLDVLDGLIENCRKKKYTAQSLGIGSPGTVDVRSGRVTGESPNLRGWVDVELRSPFTKFGLPVVVDNDANCSAFAEYKFGAGKRLQNVIVMTLGSGIGSGIIIDGEVFHGAHSSGGELGHVSIRADGERCGCGNRGCLEIYASATAVLDRAAKLAQFHPDSKLAKIDFTKEDDSRLAGIFAAAKNDDQIAVKLLQAVTDDLAIGLAGVFNAFDPEILIIGGGVVDADAEFVKIIAQKTARLTFKSATRKIRIVPAKLGNQAGFIGAAALGMMSSAPTAD